MKRHVAAGNASLFEGRGVRWTSTERSEAEGAPPSSTYLRAYYADAVRWAANTGMTKSTDETHFSPDAPCLRCQILTFLYRAVENLAPVEDAPVE